MKFLTSMARVETDEDLIDIEIRYQSSNVFMFFLPGIATGMTEIATSDMKVGSKVISVSKIHIHFLLITTLLIL